MSKKSIVIISIITIFAVAVIYFLPNAWSKDDGIIAGNNDWIDDYYSSIVDLYEDVEMPPQSSPQSLPPIDLVTPIKDYLLWENGDGHGTVKLNKNNEFYNLKFNIGNIWFKGGSGGDGCLFVIVDNEKIGTVSYRFSKSKNLTSGETVTVTPVYYRTDIKEEDTRLEDYHVVPVKITVPNLGVYLNYETDFTNSMLKSIRQDLDNDDTIKAVYYGKLAPGEFLDDGYKSQYFLFYIYDHRFGSSYRGFKNVHIYPDESIESEYYITYGNGLIYSTFSAAENAMHYYNGNLILKKVWGE